MIFNTETTKVGKCFEDYVASLFSEEYFDIINWSYNADPDITILYRPRNERFCVECKYHFQESYRGFWWANRNKIAHYQNYSETNNIPMFIILGVGNTPDNPARMFCIPLEDAALHPNLFYTFLENYERPAYKTFFWRNGELK